MLTVSARARFQWADEVPAMHRLVDGTSTQATPALLAVGGTLQCMLCLTKP